MKKDVLSGLVDEIDRRLPDKPVRSLCELKLDSRDYENLCRWVKGRLDRATVRVSQWKAGAVIFNLITEVARREATGHRLWPIVADKFPADVRAYLFPNGHPSQELKSMIQRAARELRLRHVFDDDENQSWYITTHLQFGFTQPNFAANLPEWLCGQNLPDAVRRLLSGQLASTSFRDLWQALRYFRRDWITEGQLRAVLHNNPWILPEWRDHLVRLAREKLHLVDLSQCDSDADSPARQVVGPPHCEWTYGADPVFRCELADLQPLNLIAPHYQVFVGNVQRATLFRQEDGAYRSDQPQLNLPAHMPQIDVKLLDGEGQLHLSQMVELWDPAAEVCAFELPSGKPVDVDDSMSTTKSYALFLSPDLHLAAEPDMWARLSGQPGRLAVLLRAPWDVADAQVMTPEGAVLWRPPVDRNGAARQTTAEPPPIRIQFANREAVRVGSTVRPIVRGVPKETEIVYVRLNGRAVSFDRDGHTLSAVVVNQDDAQAGLHFDIGLRRQDAADADAQTIRVRCRADADVVGAACLHADGWTTLRSDHLISARECQAAPFRVYLPWEHRGQKVALMEGPRLLRWLGNSAAPIGRTYGMGAPLVVRSQPYNCSSNLLTIAKAISEGGIVESASVSQGEHDSIGLQLARPLPLSPDHQVVVWPYGDEREPAVLDHGGITPLDEGRQWAVSLPSCRLAADSVVAIAYQGQWLGSAIVGDGLSLLEQLSELHANLRQAAALVRWFRLPVLLRARANEAPAFAKFAHAHPDAVLASWLGADELPLSLAHDESFDRRQLEMTQLRELYFGWTPTSQQAQDIVTALSHQAEDPLGEVVISILAELPLLTGHVILHWLTARGTPGGRPVSFYLEVLKRQVASRHWNGHTSPRQLEELLTRAAESMKAGPQATADEHFVQQAIAAPAIRTLQGESLTSLERGNLAVALHVASFRQYLANCVLSDVERARPEL